MDIKQDIRFYDFDFNLVYITSDWISLNWDIRYNGVGTFELQASPLSGIVEMLNTYPHLVAIQGNKQAIITGKKFDDDITIYGRTPNWLLSKRVILPFETHLPQDIESIIRSKLTSVFDADDNFALGTTVGGFEQSEEFILKSPKDMLTFVTENLEETDAGHRLIFEPLKHRWLFEIYRGEEKNLIISETNNNAYLPQYCQDILDMANGLYYKDEATGKYVTIPTTEKGILRWYAIGKAKNSEDARIELKKLKENSSVTYESTLIKYNTDYKLGDIFYVETQFGGIKVRRACMVKGVRIWDEALNCGERPEFEERGG